MAHTDDFPPPPPAPRGPEAPDQPWGPPPAPRLHSTGGLGTAVLVVSGLLVLTDVASALTSFSAVDAYEAAVAEGRDPMLVFTAHDGLTLVRFAVLVAVWVIGSLWLSRAQRNAIALEPREVRRSPAWSWLGWVVPIVSFWFPKQIVDDSWRVAARRTGGAPGRTWMWWLLWLVYLILLNVATRLVDDYPESSGISPGLEVTIACVSALAMAAWVPIVLGLSRAHERLLGGPVAPPAPPAA